jgi:hypothetical protein
MNHVVEDSIIGKLDFDCPILMVMSGIERTGLSQFLFHYSRTFGLVLLVDTGGWKFSWKAMPVSTQ